MEKQPISLDAFRKQKETEQKDKENQPLWGKMVWLHCPSCDRIEYTEVLAPHGRRHSCGTLVEEAEVEMDLRAELTLCEINLKRIGQIIEDNNKSKLKKLLAKSLDKTLETLRQSELQYRERLILAAGGELKPYQGDLESLKDKLTLAQIDAIGLAVSPFRMRPQDRFHKE